MLTNLWTIIRDCFSQDGRFSAQFCYRRFTESVGGHELPAASPLQMETVNYDDERPCIRYTKHNSADFKA
ncbi:unnamed protein product [Nippostrongylus brasiliensis]|uniref:Crotonobetainyl-CoA:carnitine CoA-transferase n=1 Tax=Nippostrongylus brasiliensis TaxID=27835 RepID=A0A0N4Y0M5_NIPBR|nr:hypothetical protein Q1695_008784 [Nippostrongylus brasiliensis]VDL72685.1 unnamed protein product [Nippostrongylus brasiliensis]